MTTLSILRRELAAYFSTSLAAVFLVVFLVAAGVLTFYSGDFFEHGQADLSTFFSFHPWLFVVLMPALAMRLWAEEQRTGTIELLMTMPVSPWEVVVGKFLAAWIFAALALVLTFPIWITVNYLGSPDNGVIFASYVGSLLMAGSFLALACCVSALTSSQVSAFVLSVAASVVLLIANQAPLVALLGGIAPGYLVDLIASLSLAQHFDAITRGVLEGRDVVFFIGFIALLLFLNCQILNIRRGN
ncbi:MAG TPA: ABC transporter permease [Devosiaceae bacterium]|jgi:ABC-2 type transport system permease protein